MILRYFKRAVPENEHCRLVLDTSCVQPFIMYYV